MWLCIINTNFKAIIPNKSLLNYYNKLLINIKNILKIPKIKKV